MGFAIPLSIRAISSSFSKSQSFNNANGGNYDSYIYRPTPLPVSTPSIAYQRRSTNTLQFTGSPSVLTFGIDDVKTTDSYVRPYPTYRWVTTTSQQQIHVFREYYNNNTDNTSEFEAEERKLKLIVGFVFYPFISLLLCFVVHFFWTRAREYHFKSKFERHVYYSAIAISWLVPCALLFLVCLPFIIAGGFIMSPFFLIGYLVARKKRSIEVSAQKDIEHYPCGESYPFNIPICTLISGEENEQDSAEMQRIPVTRSEVNDFIPYGRVLRHVDFTNPNKSYNKRMTFEVLRKDEAIKCTEVACGICLELFTNECELTVLPCQHYFHYKCFGKLCSRHYNQLETVRCPFCELNLLKHYALYKTRNLDPTTAIFTNKD